MIAEKSLLGFVANPDLDNLYWRWLTIRHVTIIPVVAGLLFVVPIVDAQDSTPSPEHKVLAMGVGVWDAEIPVTIPGQDPKDAAKTKGVETNRMLADKWQISAFKGEFFGTPFEGHGVNGYDAKKGKYVATWVDSMSQQIDLMEGTYDERPRPSRGTPTPWIPHPASP